MPFHNKQYNKRLYFSRDTNFFLCQFAKFPNAILCVNLQSFQMLYFAEIVRTYELSEPMPDFLMLMKKT